MNSNKKSAPAIGVPLPFNRQVQPARPFKPLVAQLKTHVPAQSIKRPIAPPVYKPQPKQIAQPKMAPVPVKPAMTALSVKRPVASPVNRPQAKHMNVQPNLSMQMKSTVGPVRQQVKPFSPAKPPDKGTGRSVRNPFAPAVVRVKEPPRAASRNGGTIQASSGKLLAQSGPSCWLFVAEAMAQQQSNTWLLAGIMHLYPNAFMMSENDSPEAKLIKPTRKDYLAMIATICIDTADRLEKTGRATVKRERIEELLERSIRAHGVTAKAVNRCVRHLFPEDRDYSTDNVRALLKSGAELALTIGNNLLRDKKESSTRKVLGGAPTVITSTARNKDIALTLQNLPNSLLSVNPRYRVSRHKEQYDAPSDTYDLTEVGLDQIRMGNVAHALLFVSVNYPGNPPTLTYKDPNVGNSNITITFDQLREMARRNGDKISVLTIHSESSVLRALRECKFARA